MKKRTPQYMTSSRHPDCSSGKPVFSLKWLNLFKKPFFNHSFIHHLRYLTR
jgi:hypothetical protein